jgi:hypothetical protein
LDFRVVPKSEDLDSIKPVPKSKDLDSSRLVYKDDRARVGMQEGRASIPVPQRGRVAYGIPMRAHGNKKKLNSFQTFSFCVTINVS